MPQNWPKVDIGRKVDRDTSAFGRIRIIFIGLDSSYTWCNSK